MNKVEAIKALARMWVLGDDPHTYNYDIVEQYINTISTKAALYDALIANTAEHIVQATMEQHMAEMTQCYMGKENNEIHINTDTRIS